MNWQEIVDAARIMIVDDEQSNVVLMERILAQVGYQKVHGVTDPSRAVGLFKQIQPDLLILDLLMPKVDGFQIMEELQRVIPPRTYVPILVLTADLSEATRFRALLLGANDFLTKPVDRLDATLRIRILLQTRFLFLDVTGALTDRTSGG